MMSRGAAPDDEFELRRMIPIRLVSGRRRSIADSARQKDRQRHDRQDDEQHQAGRFDQQIALLGGDIAGRGQNHEIAAAQQDQTAVDRRGEGDSKRYLPDFVSGCSSVMMHRSIDIHCDAT